MYAVIQTGGKQRKVEAGQRLMVEKTAAEVGEELRFTPLLVVDGSTVVSGPALSNAAVSAVVVAKAKGPKVVGFTYKPKTNNRRHWGHRQPYHEIEVTGIDAGTAG